MKTIETELVLTKEVHMRPLQAIAAAIGGFESSVIAHMDGFEGNAKSLLDLLDLVAKAKKRNSFRFVVSGSDADDVVGALKSLEHSVMEFSKNLV